MAEVTWVIIGYFILRLTNHWKFLFLYIPVPRSNRKQKKTSAILRAQKKEQANNQPTNQTNKQTNKQTHTSGDKGSPSGRRAGVFK